MIHLKSVRLEMINKELTGYPYNLPIIRNLDDIRFNKPVTILVGENGTGKSTLLEGLASSYGSITIGGENVETELSRELMDNLKLVWSIKTRKGFYFRANDFINFIKRLIDIKQESKQAINRIADKGKNNLEAMPHARTLYELEKLYGQGLEYRSHGESFLDLFKVRFQPGGLYILDEPEAPLSPMKQLTLISMMKEMVKAKSQFIIATHSPMLMAFPDADILAIEDGIIKNVSYDDLEHVNLTRDFLNRPENFLRHL